MTQKMNRRTWLSLFFLLSVLLVIALTPGLASAHGRKDLVGGKYQIGFGFLAEPAFTGESNGIDLTVCEGACQTQDGKTVNPIKDVQKTLKAQAIFGSQTLDVELKPRFNADGKYNGYFFPSKAGEYTFRFYGTINGDAVDVNVTSGKDGFSLVEDPKSFPAVSGGGSNLEQQVKEAKDSASSATIFGIIGLVVGALGVIAGGAGLLRRPKAVNIPVVGEGRDTVASGSGRGPQGG